MRPVPIRKPCLGILFCAVPGILLSDLVPGSLPFAALALLCFTFAFVRSRGFLPFCLLVFTIFFIRHDLDWRGNSGRLPLDLLSQGRPIIHATGIVTSDPVSAGYAYHVRHSRFEIGITSVTPEGGAPLDARFAAQALWTGPLPKWGDEVALTAAVAPIPAPRNPGEFNYSAYLARKGIFAQLSCDYPEDGCIVAHGKGNPLVAWARDCRAFLERRLTLGIGDDPEIAGLVETITLGAKEETSAADRDLFQRVGALHLFVVNGLHVALLAGILSVLLKLLRVYRRAFALVIIPTLFAYALITGLNPGSVRAAIMAAVMFGSSFVDRRPFSLNTLGAAALLLLVWDTNELFQEGFQFSFGVVTAIILLAGFIQSCILPLGAPDPFLPRSLWTLWQRGRELCWRKASGLAGVSVAASVGSFPFTAGYFNLVTPSGFAANLILVPIALCILAEAVFSLLASFFGAVPLLFNNVNWLLASWMLGIVHFFATLPGGHFFVSTAPGMQTGCRVTVLDLGPGQAVAIQSRGYCWLVDCGNPAAYFRIVRPFLQSCGINRLDGLILTRSAASGAGPLLDDFAPGDIFESGVTSRSSARRALNTALEAAGRPKTFLEAGDQVQLGPEVTCKVLFPPAGFEGGAAADKSLVLRIEDGASSVLLMSDSAFTGERWLMDHSRLLHSSVVVIGGQSADLAGTDGFLGAVRPFAVIRGAPGYENSSSRDRLWAADVYRQGITPFLQSDTGGVTIDLSQSGVTVSGFVNRQRVVGRKIGP